jgi:nucleoside-diphosphate-sugar epimerase
VVAAAATGALPALLNVGSGQATALRDFATLAAGLAGVEPPVEDAAVGSARSAVVTWQQADIEAAGSALGWRPRIPLAGSLADMGLSATRVPR